MSDKGYVPVDAILKLTSGCFENTIEALKLAIQERKNEIFGREVAAEVMATYPDRAIVASNDGELRAVSFDRIAEGKVMIRGSERIEIPTIRENEIGAFVNAGANSALDLFFAGDPQSALNKLSGLVTHVEYGKSLSDAQLVQSVVEAFRSPRPWKGIYEANKTVFKRSVGEDVAALLDEAKLQSKFVRLYAAGAPRLIESSALVNSDLAYVKARYEAVRSLVSESKAALNGVADKLTDEIDKKLVRVLERFVEDLDLDLSAVCTKIGTAVKDVSALSERARLYDVLAARLYMFEMAGRYVAKHAADLSKVRGGI